MALPLYEDVIVTTDVPAHDIRAGDVGTVVEQHVIEGKEDGYSVEFFGGTGRTVAVITLPASSLRQPTPKDRWAARENSQAD